MNLLIESVSETVLLPLKIEVGLEVEPELGRDSEVATQTQGRVRGYASVSMNNLVDSTRRNADVLGEAILGDVHGLEEFLYEHLARVDGGHFHLFHTCPPSDSRRSQLHRHFHHAIGNRYAIDR